MRVITFLWTLVLALAFIVLNFLGFNETLSQTQYIFISAAAEIILCFVLGHFMYRTYANYKRAKQLNADLNTALGKPEKSRRRNKRHQEDVKAAPQQPAPAQQETPAASPVEENINDTTTLYAAPVVPEENTEVE